MRFLQARNGVRHQCRFGITLVSTVAFLLLSGCANVRESTRINDTMTAKTVTRANVLAHPRQPDGYFSVSEGFYAEKTPLLTVPVNPSEALPPQFMKPTAFDVQTPIALATVVSMLTARTGMMFVVDQDLLETGHTAAARPAAAAPAPQSQPAAGGLPPLPGVESASVESSSWQARSAEPLTLSQFIYKGTLAGMLDALTGKLNISWRYAGNKVEFFRYETRMFRLNALDGTSSTSANLSSTSSGSTSSGSSGGGSGVSGSTGITGASGQTTTVSAQMKIWDDVLASVKSILSKDGQVTAAPSAGLITVRDTPAVLRQVDAQMAEFNRVYDRQVALNIEVYSVERNASDDLNADWSAFWHGAGKYGLSLISTGTQSSAAASPGPAFTFTRDAASGPFSNSKAMLAALSAMGKTTLMTSGTAITLNGQSVPFNVSREQAYLQSYSTNISGSVSGTTTTTLTPGIVSDGFAMNFTPRIGEDGDVNLRYAIDLSTINSITTFTAPNGSAAIQLPQRSVRDFLQNVRIHSGQTLVLTGFQQLQAGNTEQGPAHPSLWFLGGSRATNTLNRTLVIVVTPYVMR